MLFEITINKDCLFEEARMLSSFEGKSAYNDEGASMYDVVKVLQQDRPLLEKYVREGVQNVISVLREFVVGIEGGVIRCEMPTSFNAAFVDEVRDAVYGYLVNHAFCLYLGMKYDGRAKDYGELANQNLKDMREKVYFRMKPIKKLWNGDKN